MEFRKDIAYGEQFEDFVYKFLTTHADFAEWSVQRAQDILGEGEYREDDRKYPDFLVRKDDIAVFIDAKRKKGYGKETYITVDMTFVESYMYHKEKMELSGQRSKALIYFYCEKTREAYRVDLETTPFELKYFDNKYNKDGEATRVYYVRDLEEIQELSKFNSP
tara:strand:+ start:976 stop:1467 length:492 start_codon:yes stop_codon:yes gene_type:complete